jgi:hypothetical protein
MMRMTTGGGSASLPTQYFLSSLSLTKGILPIVHQLSKKLKVAEIVSIEWLFQIYVAFFLSFKSVSTAKTQFENE